MTASAECRSSRLRWAEINDVIAADRVVILPTGSTERPGRHALPGAAEFRPATTTPSKTVIPNPLSRS